MKRKTTWALIAAMAIVGLTNAYEKSCVPPILAHTMEQQADYAWKDKSLGQNITCFVRFARGEKRQVINLLQRLQPDALVIDAIGQVEGNAIGGQEIQGEQKDVLLQVLRDFEYMGVRYIGEVTSRLRGLGRIKGQPVAGVL